MASDSQAYIFCVKKSRPPYTTKLRIRLHLVCYACITLHLNLTLFSQLLHQPQQRLVSADHFAVRDKFVRISPTLLIIRICYSHTFSPGPGEPRLSQSSQEGEGWSKHPSITACHTLLTLAPETTHPHHSELAARQLAATGRTLKNKQALTNTNCTHN